MKQVTYNKLKNARIKGIALGIMIIGINTFFVCLFYQGILITGTYKAAIISFLCFGLLFLLALVPFAQVIEKGNDENINAYYLLGRLRFKLQTFGKLRRVAIEQDDKRFYCIVARFDDGQNLMIERYPTLVNATTQMEEIKRNFD